jgi:5-methylcytosine-specific restriction endonuclease McrA
MLWGAERPVRIACKPCPRSTTRRDRFRRIIRRDEPPCHVCGEPIDYEAHHLDPLSFTIDHVHPIALGGPDTLDNCAAAHRKCNRDASDKVLMPQGVTFVTERDW